MRFSLVLILACLPVLGQEKLSLRSAVVLALHQNKSLGVSRAAVQEAGSHVSQARAAFFPKLDYTESLTRSDNPVFVFGSLLTQHQFTSANFALNTLNRPVYLSNFQSSVTLNQILFDAGKTRNDIRSASSLKEMANQDDREVRIQIILQVAKSYLDAALSREMLAAAAKAVQSAQADLARAEEVRRAGMSTDADVLSIRLHLAQVRQQQIAGSADLAVAQAALDDSLGIALDVTHELTTPFRRLGLPASSIEDLENSAVLQRPEQLKINYAQTAARHHLAATRAALLPSIAVHGAFEADRQEFLTRGGANWTGSVALTWNILNGGGDKSRIEEAAESVARLGAQSSQTSSSVRLDVRRAWENLRAASQQIDVSQSAVAEAAESLRIVQNRYQAGLSTVTDLLRTESAALDAQTQYLAALHRQRLSAVILDAATGLLSVDSPALED